jgi:hypothetical protein
VLISRLIQESFSEEALSTKSLSAVSALPESGPRVEQPRRSR